MDVEEFGAEALQERLKRGALESRPGQALTLRERFRRTMFFQALETPPNFEFGYWDRTLEVWRGQGLPDWVVDEGTAYRYFGIENWAMIPLHIGPNAICEAETLEETPEHIVYRDALGCVAKINRKGDRSIPHFIDFPIKDRATWERFKPALDPDAPGRFDDLDKNIDALQNATIPVGVPGGSLVGTPRNLIGFERIAMLSYEDPELFQDIVDTFGRLICTGLDRALPRIQVDFCMGWEDMCFNQGPVISPDVMRQVVRPWYRRIADMLVTHGCCIYTTDCDGNVTPIVDIFLESGMNTLFPAEVHAGTDPVTLRAEYGKRIRIWGGVDKMVLIHSKEAIDRELERIRPAVEQGGFLPGVDHRVPADVPLDLYKYYLDRKRALFHVGGEPSY